jgi:hypothetical protein
MNSLLSEIDAFITTHDMSEWQFGERALNDRRFVKELRRGRRCWPETEGKVRNFIATYAPAQEAAQC